MTLANKLASILGYKRQDRVTHSLGRMKHRLMILATEIGATLEPGEEGGWNVWPPAVLDNDNDPFAGDHYADTPRVVEVMLLKYQSMMPKLDE